MITAPVAPGMRYGRIAGLSKPLSRVVIGTATIGRRPDLAALLDRAIELGCTGVDTGRVYGDGAVEQAVGRWLQQRNVAGRVVIIAKGGHPAGGRSRIARACLLEDLRRSLDALRVGVVDVFLVHRDDASMPVGGIVDTLHEIVETNQALVGGVSNWTVARIADAQAYAAGAGLRPLALSSPQFSLAEWTQSPWPGCRTLTGVARRAERDWYASSRMPVLAWSSLAGIGGRASLGPYDSADNRERWRRAQQLAEQRDLPAAVVALAYVLTEPLDIYAVVSSSDGHHLAENVAAASVRLTAAERAWLSLEIPEDPS